MSVNLLQAKPTQFSQTLLLFRVFQFPDHLCGLLLDVLQYAYICLERHLRASLCSAGRMTKKQSLQALKWIVKSWMSKLEFEETKSVNNCHLKIPVLL